MTDARTRELERIFQKTGTLEDELAWLRERQRGGESVDSLLPDFVKYYQKNPKPKHPEYLSRFGLDETVARHIPQNELSEVFEIKQYLQSKPVEFKFSFNWRILGYDNVYIRYFLQITVPKGFDQIKLQDEMPKPQGYRDFQIRINEFKDKQ